MWLSINIQLSQLSDRHIISIKQKNASLRTLLHIVTVTNNNALSTLEFKRGDLLYSVLYHSELNTHMILVNTISSLKDYVTKGPPNYSYSMGKTFKLGNAF